MSRLDLRRRRWSWYHDEQNQQSGHFLDFVVDNTSLCDILEPGMVSQLGSKDQLLTGLLLETPPSLSSGRYELYGCLCGDIMCGSITVAIERAGDRIVWKDFAHEDGEAVYKSGFGEAGPFEFEIAQYRQALLSWPLKPESKRARKKPGLWIEGVNYDHRHR